MQTRLVVATDLPKLKAMFAIFVNAMKENIFYYIQKKPPNYEVTPTRFTSPSWWFLCL